MSGVVNELRAINRFAISIGLAASLLLAACGEPDPQLPGGAGINAFGGIGGSNAMPTTCGDGVVFGEEQCEANDLRGATCEAIGRIGTVQCIECQIDYSQCTLPNPVISGAGGTAATGGAAGSAATGGIAGVGGTAGVAGAAGVGGTAGVAGMAGAGGMAGIGGMAGVGGTAGVAGMAGVSGMAGIGGMAGTAGSAGVITECTPNQTETLSCGTCGEQTRTCLADGTWGAPSPCDDACTNPACAGQTQKPTWDSNVGPIIQARCGACHFFQASQYSSVVSWRSFDAYAQRGPLHYLPSPDLEVVSCWIALGKPQN